MLNSIFVPVIASVSGSGGGTMGSGLKFDLNPVDWVILLIYLVFVIGIGFALKRQSKTARRISSCRAVRSRVGSPVWLSFPRTSARRSSSAWRRPAPSTAS